ncbi:sodium/proton antiporter (NhaA family) [Labedella gwakjiensis]|uniref:Na(+)/H(+) antiporter NhaA n=1 Tax=Labedella gwakjiensis TaxID=390269 RepID=A0A2P8GT74_9MICO|nr:Na+/H+ antiporter NhaA [Labedella gwakjiensis]PSL37173.1 sodium/proton antiporter (NhaA family) [Labedella gwakjiensis]RUQ81930.1 Na+/H+ antiporter NhaA [Labedella gwakjiensis]
MSVRTSPPPSAPERRPVRDVGRLLRRLRDAPDALRGALVLLAATVVALVWANLPSSTYESFRHVPLGVEVGSFSFELDLLHWVNDALMALFFAHVTLEVRRELELGELRDMRRASVPLIAAVAGLIVPALVYIAITWGTGAVAGWGVVVSTDTAFVLGLLALVGRAMPPALRIFLVTLAVADDVGALAVIAFAYTERFTPAPLLLVALGLGIIVVMRFGRVWRSALYLLPSVVVWVGLLLSGIHATLAGVAIALLLPIFATRFDDLRKAQDQVRAFQMTPTASYARSAENSLARAVSVNERAYTALSPYVTWLILPVFALANAGVRITPDSLADAFTSRLTWGIIIGLVVGKSVAITVTTVVVTRIRPDALGPSLRIPHVLGVGLLSGMGFTISLFVTELAFDDPADVSRAQIGVIAATTIAALLGALAFAVMSGRERRRFPHRDRLLRPFDPSRDPVLGDPTTAVIAVVEYGNFATPFSPAATEMRREMLARFGHDVCHTVRHLPLEEPYGRTAALAIEAAALQGRFWEMRDALIAEAPIRTDRDIRRAAAAAGLNLRRFESDVSGEGRGHRVDEDVADASAMHITRAPTFYIDDVRYDGAIDADSVNAAVAAALAAARAGRSTA